MFTSYHEVIDYEAQKRMDRLHRDNHRTNQSHTMQIFFVRLITPLLNYTGALMIRIGERLVQESETLRRDPLDLNASGCK